jgi:hypothetical protein
MSSPIPPIKLDSGCSGIFENTVYTYQSDAFQSLRLEKGAGWIKLNMGVSVDKAKCVVGAVDGQDALFVVGGISEQKDYSGLQRYTFTDKQWRTINIPDPNLQMRQMHGAAYLNETKSILVYAGYQSNQEQDSSQTFTISTTSPYTPKSYTSKAPPGINPILLPWNSTHAVMAGGSTSNQQVWVFSESGGWVSVPIVLPPSRIDMTKVRASILQGDNSSKVLELFDLSKSPNKVTALMVQPATGQAMKNNLVVSVAPRSAIVARKTDSLDNKAIDLSQLPRYDGTNAPKYTRSGYALAQASSGLVVISGGAGAQEPLAIFNQTGNSWVNVEKFFDLSMASALTPSSTSAPTSSSSSIIARPTAAAHPSGSSGTNNTRIILGSVLGGLFGIAAICIIILLILRRHRARNQSPKDDVAEDQSRRMHIDDSAAAGRGVSPADTMGSLKRGYAAKNVISNPRYQDERTSPNEGLTAFPSIFTNTGGTSKQAPRDQGWSQYFAGDNGSHIQSNYASAGLTPDTSGSRLTTYTEGSDYTNSSHPHVSAEVPPLNIRSSQLPPFRLGDDNQTFLGTDSSEQDSYDPIGSSRGTWNQRPASSIYADSINHPRAGQHALLSQFPSVPASPHTGGADGLQAGDRGMRTMASRDFGGAPGMHVASDGTAHKVTTTVAPRSHKYAHIRGDNGDDMSWLDMSSNR